MHIEREGDQLVHRERVVASDEIAVDGPARSPERLARERLRRQSPQLVCSLELVRGGREERVPGLAALQQVAHHGIGAAQHAVGVYAIDRLRRATDVRDIGAGGDPQPHVQVAGVGARRVVAAGRSLHGRPHDDLRRGDAVVRRAAAQPDPLAAGPDRGPAPAPGRARQRVARAPVRGAAVHEADVRVVLHDLRSARQGAWREQVVGRQQHDVLAPGPLETLIRGRDEPHVLRVAAQLDARVTRCQRPADGLGLVGRAVVDYEHAHVDALLDEHAFHAALEYRGVPVARDDDAHARPTHRR